MLVYQRSSQPTFIQAPDQDLTPDQPAPTAKESIEHWLARCGYTHSRRHGRPDTYSYDLYRNQPDPKDTTNTKWVVVLDIDDYNSEIISVTNWPDLIHLLALLAPIITTPSAN